MFILILGGSACGKSEYAENLCLALATAHPKLYIATMRPYGEDAAFRIARHQKLRASKGFTTLEQYTDLANYTPPEMPYHTMLLECMSNLLANEYFRPDGATTYRQNILEGIDTLRKHSKNLIVISNHIFADGVSYDLDTTAYLHAFATLNQTLASQADIVVELCCGIPRILKGQLP